SAGRGHQHCDRDRRERTAARLYAPPGRAGERDQRDALRKAQPQFHARHRAGRGPHPLSQRDRGESVGTGQDRSRTHCLGESQSGQAQHGVLRRRLDHPRVRRTVQDVTGINMVHVPYRGGAPALTDLISGQVQVMFDNVPTSIEFIRAGKLRPLAVTTTARSNVLPDLPTVADFVPGYEASAWYGVGVPKETPEAIIDKLNRETNAILADPKARARFDELGASLIA